MRCASVRLGQTMQCGGVFDRREKFSLDRSGDKQNTGAVMAQMQVELPPCDCSDLCPVNSPFSRFLTLREVKVMRILCDLAAGA